MYIEKLSGSLQFFLENEEEQTCNDIDGNIYMKFPITSDVIAVYFSEKETVEDLKLLFYYSKSKKDIVMTFKFYSKVLEDISEKKLDKIVLIEVFNSLVNKEFQTLIETMDIDDVDMKLYHENKEFVNHAKDLYQKNQEFVFEKVYRKDDFTPEELANIATNIYDFAYEEMENHLTNEILSKIKNYAITQRMINAPEIYFGKEFEIEKEFISIGNRKFKYLKLTLETSDGCCIEEQIENSPTFYKKYPIYTIKTIETLGNIVYRRDESLSEIYKNDLEYNKTLTEKQFLYIPRQWFDNEEFIEFMSLRTGIYFRMSDRLKSNKVFVLTLMQKLSISRQKELYKNLSNTLRMDKDFLIYLMKNVHASLFEEASFDLQLDDDVLECYFKNIPTISLKETLLKQLFEYSNVKKAFSNFYCKRNLEVQPKFLKYIEDIDIAKSCAKLEFSFSNCHGCNFNFFDEKLIYDNDFVLSYVDELLEKEFSRKVNFMSIYNHLNTTQQKDESLCCELISKLYICKKYDYEHLLDKDIKTKKFKIAMLNHDLRMLTNLSIEEQDELLVKNPHWTKYSYLANQLNFAEEHLELLKEMVITEPSVLKYFTLLEDKTLEELLMLNPEGFKYIVHNLKDNTPLCYLKCIQDKVYVLDEIVNCYYKNNFKIFSVTKNDLFEFLLEQLKIKNKNSTPFVKTRDLVEFDKRYKTNFQEDTKLIYTLAKQNPNIVLNLPKKSIFRKDKAFAKFILKQDINLKVWFHPCLWEDKSFVKELYDGLNEFQRKKASSFFLKFL